MLEEMETRAEWLKHLKTQTYEKYAHDWLDTLKDDQLQRLFNLWNAQGWLNSGHDKVAWDSIMDTIDDLEDKWGIPWE